MKYLLSLAILALVCAPVSAQRTHGKRTHDKAKVERVAKCEKECKCICHKSKKSDHAKRGKHGDRKRSDRRRIQVKGRGKAPVTKKTQNRRSTRIEAMKRKYRGRAGK